MTLYQYHSYAACIGEGFGFLAKHLLMITKVMMPFFTVTAVFLVLYIAMLTRLTVEQTANGEIDIMDYFTAIVLYILVCSAAIISNARTFLMFRRMTGAEIAVPGKETEKGTAVWKVTTGRTLSLAWRSMPYLVWIVLLNIPGFTITGTLTRLLGGMSIEYRVLSLAILLIALLVLAVILTPIIYTYYCRMMEPTFIDDSNEVGKVQKAGFTFKVAYKKAMRHKGKILGVTALSAFIVCMVNVIMLIPGIISINAYFSSVEGSVNFNDEVLIPTSAYIWMLIVSSMALAISQLFGIVMHTALLYLHGDIYSNSQCTTHNS